MIRVLTHEKDNRIYIQLRSGIVHDTQYFRDGLISVTFSEDGYPLGLAFQDTDK